MATNDTRTTGKVLLCAALPIALALAGCGQKAGDPAAPPSDSVTGAPSSAAASGAAATASPSATPTDAAAAPLDYRALTERDDPERLLRFYAQAMQQGDWHMAALAWDSSAHITADILSKSFQRDTPPKLAIGTGTREGAAGSLFYEAPVELTYSDGGESVRGTITVRRANDVPGASEEALAWRIERSTIGPEL